MRLDLHFTLTPDDLLDFRNAQPDIPDHFKSRGRSNRLYQIAGWVAILLLAWVFFRLFGTDRGLPPAGPGGRKWSLLADGGLALLLLFSFAMLSLRRWFLYRQAKRSVLAAFIQAPHLAKPQDVTITEEKLVQLNAAGAATIHWSDCTDLIETPSTFFLYLGGNSSLILPKRGFASPADIDTFRGIARARVDIRPLGFPVLPAKEAPPPAPRSSG
jgi:hypothetical protein